MLLLLMALLWWWFLGRPAPAPTQTGTFGQSPNQTSSGNSGTQTPTNIGTPLTPVGGYQIGGTASQGYGGGGGSITQISTTTYTYKTPSGVSWIGGPFTPTPINQVGSANPTPPPPGSAGGGGNDAAANALIGGAAQCTVFITRAVAGVLTGSVFSPSALAAVRVDAPTDDMRAFLDCMTRALARVALQQMTNSVLKWVNSGFNGQPAYVQSFQQLFLTVADQAAGQFIQGSALSFLCTPFQNPVRIAIAQSYARRNASANSCTLSKVLAINNINGFMNGNFSQGGWQGFLSFVSSPTNNPFGAYLYGQSALQSSISQAQQYTTLDLQNGRGFQSYYEPYNCKAVIDPISLKTGQSCQYRITTPGSVIEPQVNNSLGTGQRQLELAKNFDDIVSVFLQTLVTSALYSGLSHAGTPSAPPTLTQAGQALLNDLQQAVGVAQQYGYTKQGAISDIQNAQSNLKNLANCYESKGNSTAKQAALDKIASLESRVGSFNNQITTANASISTLETLMTRALATHSDAEAAAVRADFDAAAAAGQLITANDLTTAQQDRTTLQSEMTTLNQDTATKLNQCYAS